MASKAMVC